MEYLPQIFTEAAGENFLLPFSPQLTILVMTLFGGHDLLLPAVVATVGATLGQALNFLLGRGMLILKHKGQLYLNDTLYKNGHKLMSGVLLPLLLFSWYPLMLLAVIAAGFFNVSWKRALPVLLIGQAGYFAYLLIEKNFIV